MMFLRMDRIPCAGDMHTGGGVAQVGRAGGIRADEIVINGSPGCPAPRNADTVRVVPGYDVVPQHDSRCTVDVNTGPAVAVVGGPAGVGSNQVTLDELAPRTLQHNAVAVEPVDCKPPDVAVLAGELQPVHAVTGVGAIQFDHYRPWTGTRLAVAVDEDGLGDGGQRGRRLYGESASDVELDDPAVSCVGFLDGCAQGAVLGTLYGPVVAFAVGGVAVGPVASGGDREGGGKTVERIDSRKGVGPAVAKGVVVAQVAQVYGCIPQFLGYCISDFLFRHRRIGQPLGLHHQGGYAGDVGSGGRGAEEGIVATAWASGRHTVDAHHIWLVPCFSVGEVNLRRASVAEALRVVIVWVCRVDGPDRQDAGDGGVADNPSLGNAMLQDGATGNKQLDPPRVAGEFADVDISLSLINETCKYPLGWIVVTILYSCAALALGVLEVELRRFQSRDASVKVVIVGRLAELVAPLEKDADAAAYPHP